MCEVILTIIAGFISIIITYSLNKKKDREIDILKFKEEKYFKLIQYMLLVEEPFNIEHFSDLKSDYNEILNDVNRKIKDKKKRDKEVKKQLREYVDGKIYQYYDHCLLYASDNVIKAFKNFLKDPSSNKSYYNVLIEIRKDLNFPKIKTKYEDLII